MPLSTIIKPGICSVTMRQLTAAELVGLASQAGLEAIEWGGDIHVPTGDLAAAHTARRLTVEAGMAVSSYGSYYKVLTEAGQPAPFGPVLDTALALGAQTIRIWAGHQASDNIAPDTRKQLVAALHAALTTASQAGVKLAVEFHANTLADSNRATLSFLNEINHPALYTYWQPIYWLPDEDYRLAGLRELAARVLNVHVFQWRFRPGAGSWTESTDRRHLEEGAQEWARYLAVPLSPEVTHHALMEFVRGDDPAQLLRDAATLKKWCAQASVTG